MSWKTYTIKEETDQTVSVYVKERFSLSSRNLQTLFRKKQVKINSRVAHSKRVLKKGDTLTIQLPKDKDYGVAVETRPIHVLYEDKHTLVINKEPFMLVHPTGQTKEHTLSSYVAGYYAKKGVIYKIRPIHRLDRDTSGCILFGKTKEAQQYYTNEMQIGRIQRIYVGIVEGQLEGNGVINEPIGPDLEHGNRRVVDEFGQIAETQYTVLTDDSTADSSTHAIANNDCSAVMTLVQFTIPTGRTHQIRVHMAHMGHPIVGDAMYGTREKPYTRQCLHAQSLSFVPYESTDMITVTAPISENFGKEENPKI